MICLSNLISFRVFKVTLLGVTSFSLLGDRIIQCIFLNVLPKLQRKKREKTSPFGRQHHATAG